MIAIGFGLAWFGYSVALYGYCLVKQYDVSYLDLIKPGGPGVPWPPPENPDAASAQQPQPIVDEQYLAPLTMLAGAVAAIATFLGGLLTDPGGAAGGAVGAVEGLLQGIPGIPNVPAAGSPQASATVKAPPGATPPAPPTPKQQGVKQPVKQAAGLGTSGWTVFDAHKANGWTVIDGRNVKL